MKNKRKEKSFVQGPIMLGITIGLGIFVCTAAALMAFSYLGIIGVDALTDIPFTPPEGIEYKVEMQDGIGLDDSIEVEKIDLP